MGMLSIPLVISLILSLFGVQLSNPSKRDLVASLYEQRSDWTAQAFLEEFSLVASFF